MSISKIIIKRWLIYVRKNKMICFKVQIMYNYLLERAFLSTVLYMEKKEIEVKPEFVEPIEVDDYSQIKKGVNEARINFLENHKKVMKKNKIASGIFFVLAVGLVIVGYTWNKFLGLCFGVVCAALVVVWLYTRHQRKILDGAVADYLYAYSLYCNSYMYKDEHIKNIQIGYKQHPDPEVLKKFNIADNVSQIVSRELIKGNMFDHDFIAADVSLKSGNPKKQRDMKALLVGKAFIFDYKFNEEGRTFLYLKGCGDAAPTKLEDVNKVEVNKLKKEWEVYTSHKNYNKIFTESFVKALNKFETDKVLNDIVISIVDGHILVGLSYCDEAMVIPMHNEYDTKFVEHKVEDFKIVKLINKSLIENSDIIK